MILRPRWGQLLRARLRRQQQLLEAGSGHPLQSTPLLNGNQHRSLHTSPGHHLRTLGQAGLQHLAEPGLGVRVVCPRNYPAAPSSARSAGDARRTLEGLVGNLLRAEAGLSRCARQTMPAVDRTALGQYAKLAVDARSAKINLLANLPTSQQLILSTGKLPKWHIGLFTHSW